MAVKWHAYEATIQFDDRLVGGIPIVPAGADRADAYEQWGRGQGVEQDESFDKPLHEELANDPDMPTSDVAIEDVEGLETGFRRDEAGLYVECRQVKAMLRESAQRLGLIKRKRGSRQVMQHDLHVRSSVGSPDTPFGGDPKVRQKLHFGVDEPSGKDMRPISVITRQGPRTAIKRFEYMDQPELSFRIFVLAEGVGDGLLGEEELRDMLEFGGTLGIGADRSQGEGTFMLQELKPINGQ